MQARALLLAALAALALAREPPAAPCPARCDVSRCPSPRCPGGYVPDLCNCCLVCAAGEGEPCGRALDSPCGESLECARGVCRCRWAHAVCGTDGHTYANVCALQAASRRALQLSGTPVRQLQKGACPSGKQALGSGRRRGVRAERSPGEAGLEVPLLGTRGRPFRNHLTRPPAFPVGKLRPRQVNCISRGTEVVGSESRCSPDHPTGASRAGLASSGLIADGLLGARPPGGVPLLCQGVGWKAVFTGLKSPVQVPF